MHPENSDFRNTLNKFNYTYYFLAQLLILLVACSRGTQSNDTAQQETGAVPAVQRPREAWVLRSVLDLKPRMLSIALHDKLWLAYNTQTASLYKAWNGTINFEGSVYTTAHGPQPTTEGISYMQEPDSAAWQLVANGTAITPEVIYKGHHIINNQVTLNYVLLYPGGQITIAEKPEVKITGGEQISLERIFTTSGVPAGVQVSLNMHLNSLLNENDYQTDGRFTVSEKSAEEVATQKYYAISGQLQLNPNARTSMLVKLSPKPAPPVVEYPVLSNEEAVSALMAKSDCNTCHNKELRTVGPSYQAIAARYDNTPQITERLINKVIKGGAGNWGQIPMTPHPDLAKEDAGKMVAYILALDAGKAGKATAPTAFIPSDIPFELQAINPAKVNVQAEKPGIAVNVYQFEENVYGFPSIDKKMLPNFSGIANILHAQNTDFGDLQENFVLHASGYLNLARTTNIVFRLVCDDGARLYIDDKLVVENGGNNRGAPRDGEMLLKAGKHAFKVEYFQRWQGKMLSLQWRPHGADAFAVVPPGVFTFKGADIRRTQPPVVTKKVAPTPGDGAVLAGVHPSFTLSQARPANFKPRVGGMDFLPDGRLVVSTWDSLGAIYVLEGVQSADPENIKVKRIAYGLAEPLGLKVVDRDIYVLQKQELTKLVDTNKDDIIDEYQTVCNGWRVSANFHEFAFGLVYKDGYFYGTLATAINPGGASANPQIPDRGKVVKISRKDGSFSFVAKGLRTPNGIGLGVDNEIFIADNQGDWLPANKILHLQEGAWYGSRSVDFEGTAQLTETQPVVWLAQDEIGNSPSQPILFNVGPYQNQMVHGDVRHGGLKRVFPEKVNGTYQGAVFRFTQGLEAGTNRLVWGPDKALYIGGVGSSGNWAHTGKLTYGLQKLSYNNQPTFEMLAVRAKANGMEIEFTEPLKAGAGVNAADYTVKQWYYKPTGNYGGPKLDQRNLQVKSINVSADRKRVFLELEGMEPKHVVYIRLDKNTVSSSTGNNLWATEAWYTLNTIPAETGKSSKR